MAAGKCVWIFQEGEGGFVEEDEIMMRVVIMGCCRKAKMKMNLSELLGEAKKREVIGGRWRCEMRKIICISNKILWLSEKNPVQ